LDQEHQNTNNGRQVVDITELLGVFDVPEAVVEMINGAIGCGKTYEMTRRAIEFLYMGYPVYTNWELDLTHHNFDQRLDFKYCFWNFILFRKRYYKFDVVKNWHKYDVDRPDIVEYITSKTDCIFMADEGQDIFDSYEGTYMSKSKRKSVTRGRHYRRTLIIASQRPVAVAPTVRANITYFYKCMKVLSWPIVRFKILRTQDVDDNNLPVFTSEPEVYDRNHLYTSHFARKKIYNSYNSWYLRGGIPKSQDVFFEAFDFDFLGRWNLLYSFFVTRISKIYRKLAHIRN